MRLTNTHQAGALAMTTRNGTHPEWSTKQVFTTGEAASICKVSQQTIIRCFDSGRLQGFRVPGSKFRRIPRAELLRFMKANDIPVELLEGPIRHRILVVDDDEKIVEFFEDLLQRDPRFEVRSAGTGYDAGLLTEQIRPDVILLDYMLPDINGNVVIDRIRSTEHLAHTKIIVVSGVVNQEEINDLMKRGADDFIKKPFTIDALMSKIQRLIEA
jgi:two-component system, OmpR family, response regulator